MPLIRNDDGSWEFDSEENKHSEFGNFHPSYTEALLRYLMALDQAFIKAKERCEFEYLLNSMFKFLAGRSR